MIRILHIQTELNLACGVTRTISQIIKNSSPEFEHHLIALSGNGLSRFKAFNFNPIILNLDRFSLIGAIKIYFFLLNYCKKYSIQIIHSHHRYFDTLVWLLKPFINVKTVTSVQSKVFGKKKISYKADQLIACSNTIKQHLMNYFNLSEKRIIVINNSVDIITSHIKSQKEQYKLLYGIGSEDFIIGFVGRIDFDEKGIDVLLEAFKQIAKVNINTHLLLVGEGPNSKELNNFRDNNILKITVLSSKENIFDFYNLMDLVVLPSRVDPFPLVMLETGLMNKPFIGSDVDGIAELFEHEKDGLLFESGNVDDLKNQILRIFNNRLLADTLAKNLNKKVLESYTVEKIIPKYKLLYKNILNRIHENS